MNSRRILVVAAAGLCAAVWTYACGDGATEPPTPPPDPPRPATVAVATVRLTALGATEQLTAEVRDQNGNAMAGVAVSWASNAAAVATVSNSGLATAAGNGTATITATAGSASGSATVTVAQEVSAVAVSPATDTVVAGDTLRLAAEATDANGHPVAGAEFEWASGDTAVAVVDATGLVTGVGAGEAEVTATAAEVTGRAALAVVAPVPTTVAVTPDTVALTALGQTARLAAEVRDQSGRVIEGVRVSWSSADATIAAVDSAGLVTAIGGGATTVSATASEVSGAAVVTVMQSAGSVIVSPAAATVMQGDTMRLAAEAFDENGHRVEGAEFRWSSSDISVTTVDGSGLVTGGAEGKATITATAGDARGTAEITVENPDRAALVALYHATDGPNWVNNNNWLTDAPLGEWYGVDTDASGRVVQLVLSGTWDGGTRRELRHGLRGAIPPEIGKLANLERLELGLNSLTGPIPVELGELASLERLILTSNDLSSPIPAELAAATSLTTLDLGYNSLTGPIPSEIGNLPNLRLLNLLYNDLTGSIPPELGSLASLSALWLRDNKLSGIVPPELGGMVGLTELSLQDNDLSGPIPQSFLQLDGLRQFFIAGNGSLCVPGTSSFVTWLQGIQHNGTSCNAGDVAVLETLYELTGGTAWAESASWRGGGAVEEWYGVTADSLGRVTALDLTRNGLAGKLPERLGGLTQMDVLRIGGNALTGRLPASLAQVALEVLDYGGTELCTPADEAFREWLNAIPSHEGNGVECAPLLDREIVEILYEVTGGRDWTNNQNWLTDAPLRDWYGVRVDNESQIIELNLEKNNLTGPIPPELGSLARLVLLRLGGNAFEGGIPPELGNLTGLTELGLWQCNLTGTVPSQLGGMASLQRLELGGNALEGEIPSELGNLTSLTKINLWGNSLTGPIPPEIGNLLNLTWLDLSENTLSGPIPPELGNFPNLTWLNLQENALTGPIPPGIGNLGSVRDLSLRNNELSGTIPPEIGNLSSVVYLALDGNGLTGSLPPEIGDLPTVSSLFLDSNDLEGTVPPEFGGMSRLQRLGLAHNPRLRGALPSELTALSLIALVAGGTGLCVPSDPDFMAWLEGVFRRRIAPCMEGDPPMAYLIQAVQSRKFPVSLVSGERALLRVFVTANQGTSEGIPLVRARFFVNGRETHVEDIASKSDPVPTEVDESSLSKSANAEIPASVIQPGLEMVIEVDPDGTLDPALGVAKRIPETGRLTVDVRAMPLFDLTLIPFIWSETRDSSIVDLVEAMAADPEGHELLGKTRTLLPVASLDVRAHEPVLTSTNNAWALRDETRAIRVMEEGTGYYMGMMPNPVTGAAGVAFVSGKANFSIPDPFVIAHEIGHNLSLQHAPCGPVDGPDPSFPYHDGSVGTWGYDFRDGGALVHASTPDLMSYCGPQWISDYNFTNALRYRLFDEGVPAAAATAATKSLLLWGGIGADTIPFLEPAFVVTAAPALPDSAGQYQVVGRTSDGGQLFSLSFTMPEVADGDGSSSFAFVLPVRSGWEENLARITLTGPGGSFTLDGESDIPMAILRNPSTGQVRAILRDPPPATQAAADAGTVRAQGLEVMFSRGIPDAEAWRR